MPPPSAPPPTLGLRLDGLLFARLVVLVVASGLAGKSDEKPNKDGGGGGSEGGGCDATVFTFVAVVGAEVAALIVSLATADADVVAAIDDELLRLLGAVVGAPPPNKLGVGGPKGLWAILRILPKGDTMCAVGELICVGAPPPTPAWLFAKGLCVTEVTDCDRVPAAEDVVLPPLAAAVASVLLCSGGMPPPAAAAGRGAIGGGGTAALPTAAPNGFAITLDGRRCVVVGGASAGGGLSSSRPLPFPITIAPRMIGDASP